MRTSRSCSPGSLGQQHVSMPASAAAALLQLLQLLAAKAAGCGTFSKPTSIVYQYRSMINRLSISVNLLNRDQHLASAAC